MLVRQNSGRLRPMDSHVDARIDVRIDVHMDDHMDVHVDVHSGAPYGRPILVPHLGAPFWRTPTLFFIIQHWPNAALSDPRRLNKNTEKFMAEWSSC